MENPEIQKPAPETETPTYDLAAMLPEQVEAFSRELQTSHNFGSEEVHALERDLTALPARNLEAAVPIFQALIGSDFGENRSLALEGLEALTRARDWPEDTDDEVVMMMWLTLLNDSDEVVLDLFDQKLDDAIASGAIKGNSLRWLVSEIVVQITMDRRLHPGG